MLLQVWYYVFLTNKEADEEVTVFIGGRLTGIFGDFQYSPTCRLLGFLRRNGCVLGQGMKVFFWMYGVRGCFGHFIQKDCLGISDAC